MGMKWLKCGKTTNLVIYNINNGFRIHTFMYTQEAELNRAMKHQEIS